MENTHKLSDQDKQLIGISAWNYKLMIIMHNALRMRTNNGTVPLAKYNDKVTRALQLLEDFEQAKHGVMVNHFARRVSELQKKIGAFRWWKFWLWLEYFRWNIQHQTYVAGMVLIIDCLPDDVKVILSAEDELLPPKPEAKQTTLPQDPAQ